MSTNKTPSLILLRGLPGSGKSTLAELLSEDGKYPVYSVDQFFTDASGNYSFNHHENYLAYESCQNNVSEAMKKGIAKIFVDNTLTLDWEIEPYFKLAKENNYQIFVATVENYHGKENIHNISADQIKKMAEKYRVRLFPE